MQSIRPALLAALISVASPPAAQAAYMAAPWSMPWRWHSRILVVVATSQADPLLRRQRDLLAGSPKEAAERDLVTIEVVGDRVSDPRLDAGRMRQALRVPADGFAVILIGKDGGEKRREPRPIAASALFATIDAMPMRKEEARRAP